MKFPDTAAGLLQCGQKFFGHLPVSLSYLLRFQLEAVALKTDAIENSGMMEQGPVSALSNILKN